MTVSSFNPRGDAYAKGRHILRKTVCPLLYVRQLILCNVVDEIAVALVVELDVIPAIPELLLGLLAYKTVLLEHESFAILIDFLPLCI